MVSTALSAGAGSVSPGATGGSGGGAMASMINGLSASARTARPSQRPRAVRAATPQATLRLAARKSPMRASAAAIFSREVA